MISLLLTLILSFTFASGLVIRISYSSWFITITYNPCRMSMISLLLHESRQSSSRALITRISYKCTWWFITQKANNQCFFLITASNGFRLCSPIKASFVITMIYHTQQSCERKAWRVSQNALSNANIFNADEAKLQKFSLNIFG